MRRLSHRGCENADSRAKSAPLVNQLRWGGARDFVLKGLGLYTFAKGRSMRMRIGNAGTRNLPNIPMRLFSRRKYAQGKNWPHALNEAVGSRFLSAGCDDTPLLPYDPRNGLRIWDDIPTNHTASRIRWRRMWNLGAPRDFYGARRDGTYKRFAILAARPKHGEKIRTARGRGSRRRLETFGAGL